jgi:hypothetical protein
MDSDTQVSSGNFPDVVDLGDVLKLLNFVSDPPNKREQPRAGDLSGDYDYWFDGGACRIVTGVTTYDFSDGSSVHWPCTPRLSLTVRLSGGHQVQVNQV